MAKFEVYKDKKGETRFRFRASNGEVVFASEGYKTRASAMKTIESIKKNAPDAAVEDAQPAAPSKSTVKKVAGKAASTIAAAASAVTAPIASVVGGKSKDTKAPKKAAAPKAAPKAKAAAKPKTSTKPKSSGKAKAAKEPVKA